MIQHVFVVDASGTPVYARCIGHVCPLGNVDELAVSSLLTALNNFAKQIGAGYMQSLKLENANFVIKNSENFFVVVQVADEKHVKKIQGFMESLAKFIEKNYPDPDLVGFDDVRLTLVSNIEKFLAENKIGLRTEKKGILSRLKRFFGFGGTRRD